MDALSTLEETRIIFTRANSDTDGRIINKMIDEYVAHKHVTSAGFASLGQLRYLSALQYVDGVVGNSSSGLIEAPGFGIGTINIGERQKGRLKASSVIDCAPSKESILEALNRLYSAPFRESLRSVENPYGEGNASMRILDILRQTDFSGLLKKSFYDLEQKS